ncbi:MAG: sensor histidine kinase [Gemmatimonadetes bacterium]|nr:MAG: sensor histidine kinase [Gemmatimonadota bacterium]
MNLTFEQKVVLLLSITPVLFVVFSMMYVVNTKSTLTRQEVESGKILAKTFAKNATFGTLLQEPNKLETPFRDYLEEPSVVAVAVFMVDTGEQLAAAIDSTLLLSPSVRADIPFSEIVERLESRVDDVVVDASGSDVIYFYTPIFNRQVVHVTEDAFGWEDELNVEEQEVLFAVAEMGITLDRVKRSFNQNLIFVAIMTIVFLVAGVVIMRYIFAQWRQRTDELQEAITRSKEAEDQIRKAYKELEHKSRQFEKANEDLLQAQLETIKQRSQLVESERLATLGELSGMVAHEINNALSGISGPIDHILNMKPIDEEKIWYCWESDQDGHELQAYLEEWNQNWNSLIEAARLIETAGKRARTTVRNLQGLVGGRSRQYGTVDVCEVFRESYSLQKHREELQAVKLIEKFEEEEMKIISTSGELGQIFTNMLINAGHALVGRPDPTITVEIRHKDNGIEILFSDNGKGMPFEVRTQVFKPFFTYGKGEKGTGLGLSTVDRIVKAHGGKIHVESEEGKGTTFIMWFPYERPKNTEKDDATETNVEPREEKEQNING